MRRTILLCLALCAAPMGHAHAQTEGGYVPLPSVVVVPGNIIAGISHQYNPRQETAWCVTKWDTEDTSERGMDFTQYTVREVKVLRVSASDRQTEYNPADCRAPDGTALPMLHSHPYGACQASPFDLAISIERNAPFDGILCGDKYTTWYYSWQMRAAFKPGTVASK